MPRRTTARAEDTVEDMEEDMAEDIVQDMVVDMIIMIAAVRVEVGVGRAAETCNTEPRRGRWARGAVVAFSTSSYPPSDLKESKFHPHLAMSPSFRQKERDGERLRVST